MGLPTTQAPLAGGASCYAGWLTSIVVVQKEAVAGLTGGRVMGGRVVGRRLSHSQTATEIR